MQMLLWMENDSVEHVEMNFMPLVGEIVRIDQQDFIVDRLSHYWAPNVGLDVPVLRLVKVSGAEQLPG